jgi:hypothetical protein
MLFIVKSQYTSQHSFAFFMIERRIIPFFTVKFTKVKPYKKQKIPSDLSGGILKGKAELPRSFPKHVKSKKSLPINREGFLKERRRHTLPQNCSTICAGGLNFSVRDGKR